MPNFTIVAIVVGIVVPLGGLFVWMAFRNTEQKGIAKAVAEATAKAEEINSGMVEIQGTTREPSEVVNRMKTGTFGGQKE